jgi:hypothetical protein
MRRLNKLSLLRWVAPLGLSLAAFTLPAQALGQLTWAGPYCCW